MRGYIVILFALCTSLSAMYDGSKRLKVDNHIQVQHHPELLKLVDTSPTLKAFQADVGATAEEALEALASHQEMQMVGAYARVKANDALFRDTTSLFAKSWKKVQVSHLAQIANAANKLDIASCKEDMLALACQRVYASRFGTVKQLEHLVPDLYKEAGKRMSLDLLASMGFAALYDAQRAVPDVLPKGDRFSQIVSRHLPFRLLAFKPSEKSIIADAQISSDGASAVYAVKKYTQDQNEIISTVCMNLDSLKVNQIGEFRSKPSLRTTISPNGRYVCQELPGQEIWLCDATLPHSSFKIMDDCGNYTTRELKEIVFSNDSSKIYCTFLDQVHDSDDRLQVPSVEAANDDSLDELSLPEEEDSLEQSLNSEEEGSLEESSHSTEMISICSYDIDTQESQKIMDMPVYGYDYNVVHTSPKGRFFATLVEPFSIEEEAGYFGSNKVIYLRDEKTKKNHIICGKQDQNDNPCSCNNLFAFANDTQFAVTTNKGVYLFDASHDLPETIVVDDHAIKACSPKFNLDSRVNLGRMVDMYTLLQQKNDIEYYCSLIRPQENAYVTFAQQITSDKQKILGGVIEIDNDKQQAYVVDIRCVQDYLTSLENLNPEQVACVATIGAQYEQRNPARAAVLTKVLLSQDMKQVFDTLPAGLRERLAHCIE